MVRAAQPVLGRGNHVLSAGGLTFPLHRNRGVWHDGWPCSKLLELQVSLGWIPVMQPDSISPIRSPAQHYVNEGANEKENDIYHICPSRHK